MPETPHIPHQYLLQQQLPGWARQAAPEQWQALQQRLSPAQGLPGAEAEWFANAPPAQQQAVQASQARLLAAQQALARALAGLRQISEFSQPLLQAALAEHGLDLPLHGLELLHVQRSWSWAAAKFLYRSERQPLLQAALLNFADDAEFVAPSALARSSEVQVRAIQVSARAFTGPQTPIAHFGLPSERYEVTALALGAEAFAQLCRSLDLGQRYQAHLLEVWLGEKREPLAALAGKVRVERLRLAACLARLRHAFSAQQAHAVQRLLGGEPVACWQLSLFGLALHEVRLIDAAGSLLLYLPEHEPALHACADLSAVEAVLAALLRIDAQRQGFLGYLGLDERSRFVDLLRQNLDAHAANLHLSRQPCSAALFEQLHQQHVQRLLDEARLLAVPTAVADQQARQRRLRQWAGIGLDVLMVAGFFIPGVGGLMLAVTACQLLDETYEGWAAWSIGDQQAALGHLQAVGLNLALIGGLHGAGKLVPRLFDAPLPDTLEPITRPDGSRRLWRPDLAPYRSAVDLPATVTANAAGQFEHDGRFFIRLDGHLYEQSLDRTAGRWRLLREHHPEAWRPLLEHNGEGAWRAEHELPGQWPLLTLLRRLGPAYAGFDDQQLCLAARFCGLGEDELRQIHIQGRPVPPLLGDSLARLQAAQAPASQFARLYEADTALAPLAERLRLAHPGLPRPLARRLAARLTAAEARQWAAAQGLPAWLEAMARSTLDELALTRAVEGLWLPGLAGEDSARLLWACLPRLAQWPAGLRLELRAGGPQGVLLQALGEASASERALVIQDAQGFEAYRGERPAPGLRDADLCRAVLDALPPPRRAQLGPAGASADSLREQLGEVLASQRAGLTRLMRQTPRPSWRSGGLRGGDSTGVYPQLNLRSSLRGRYQRLFPSATDAQFNATLARWRSLQRPAEIELTRLEDRLAQWRADLARWATAAPQRQRAVPRLVQAWRRNSVRVLSEEAVLHSLDLAGLELDHADLASLALPDAFGHIEALDLSNNRQLHALPGGLLERLPGLKRLLLHDCRLASVPELPHPEQLGILDLQHNRITWDATAQARLEAFAHLHFLDLSENPLIEAPALGSLSELQFVRIADAGLTQLPQGLAELGELSVLDLGDNQLTSLPEGLWLPQQVAKAMHLESEWLAPRASQQIEAYYRQHGVDLLVTDHDYSEILDDISEQRQAIWNRLPLAYRRGLRAVLVSERYLADPPAALEELWRRLGRIDGEQMMRDYALGQPAWRILELPM